MELGKGALDESNVFLGGIFLVYVFPMYQPLRDSYIISPALRGIWRLCSTTRGAVFTLPSAVTSGSLGFGTTLRPRCFLNWLRPCSVNPLLRWIGVDRSVFGGDLTYTGLNPPQYTSIPVESSQTEQALTWKMSRSCAAVGADKQPVQRASGYGRGRTISKSVSMHVKAECCFTAGLHL
jgi:hypothetical protein